MADWYYNFLINNWTYSANIFITLLAIIFFLNPLRKISKSRKALSLMFSKEIATFLSFVLIFVDHLATTLNIHPPNVFVYVLYINTVPFISIRLHLIVMAWNRMHAVYFPFTYSKWTKKRFIQKVCISIWIISTMLSAISLYVDYWNKISNFPFVIFSRQYLDPFFIYFSMGLYVLISVKLLWIKYIFAPNAPHMDGTTMMEKDHWKISLTCLVSLVPFMLSIVLLQITLSININKMSDPVKDLMMTLKVPIQYFSFISEEVCLILICDDFRRLCGRQFRSIYAWTLWCISLGHWKLMDKNNNVNKVAATDASIRVSSLAKIRQECVVDVNNQKI